MTVGLSPTLANALLDQMYALGYRWIKLHTGEPGPAGTANPALETTRKQITSAAATGAALTSTNGISYTGVAGTEEWRYVSCWNASTGGTFGLSGQIAPKPVGAGDNVDIPAGSVTVTLPVAT